jgi:hypothetical protein
MYIYEKGSNLTWTLQGMGWNGPEWYRYWCPGPGRAVHLEARGSHLSPSNISILLLSQPLLHAQDTWAERTPNLT